MMTKSKMSSLAIIAAEAKIGEVGAMATMRCIQAKEAAEELKMEDGSREGLFLSRRSSISKRA